MTMIRTLWRVFPWDPAAAAGEPFSPSYINPCQEDGRYDLGGRPLILNLADSPAHAIGEQIQGRHGRNLRAADLRESGRPLALVRVTIGGGSSAIPDLSLPHALHRFGCRPDQLMSRDPKCSQRLSRRLHRRGGSRLSGVVGAVRRLALYGPVHGSRRQAVAHLRATQPPYVSLPRGGSGGQGA